MARIHRALSAALVGVLTLTVGGCAREPGGRDDASPASSATQDSTGSSGGGASASAGQVPKYAVPVSEVQMAKPAALTGRRKTLSPDILVNGSKTISSKTLDKIRAVPGVSTINDFSMGLVYNQETPVTYAAVDPATFRRFTPSNSALTQDIWNRVAGGEMAIREDLGKKLQDKSGYVKLGNDADAPLAHIGAYAPIVSRYNRKPVIDAVVNEKWAPKLKMTKGNALLVSTGEAAPKKIAAAIQKLVGKKASVQILAVDLDTGAQVAVLTGGSVSAALGSLRYTPTGGGRVRPDPAWVATYIRTEEVPILGKVTCNKIMLPELRAALTEVVANGLADKIHPGEYGGCFVPRFIAGSNTLSFHTFGTAIDINVPGNLRGTRGEMDRGVVAIFKKWGFGWGGDWRYTDPMHFELHQIVRPK